MLELEIHRRELTNGLTVVVHPDASLPLCAVNVWYHVGSKNERPGLTGFAHLFEHMLFQGSANVAANDHFRYVQQVGGVANGSTWYDRTNYYETLPSHCLELGLWLESDRMGFLLPAMTLDKLENQRSVVMNERRQRVDNQPYGQAMEKLNELLYPDDHPYRWPVIGYMEDIEAATLGEIETFFKTWYGPDNAVLTLAGDITPERGFDLAERWFGDLPPAGPTPELFGGGVPQARGPQEITLEDDVALTRFYSATVVPGFGSREWYAAQVLSEALASGKSSLMVDDLVNKRQLAQNVAAWVMPTEECATFGVLATVRNDAEPDELQEAVDDWMRRVREERLDDAILDQARARLQAGIWNELQSYDSRADLISQMTTYFDDPHAVGRLPERIAEITADDVLTVAREFADFSRATTVRVVPRSQDADAEADRSKGQRLERASETKRPSQTRNAAPHSSFPTSRFVRSPVGSGCSAPPRSKQDSPCSDSSLMAERRSQNQDRLTLLH